MNRAYSTLEIKAIDESGGKRTFAGIASTPSTDRMGDVVEPEGAEFALPIPFLWQHDSRQPIGWITRAKVTSKDIQIEGEVHNETDVGKLKDRLDEAWQSLKAGLVRGLSIGFNALELADIKGTWGLHYLRWNWLELSAVTIPANQDATITSIKSIDERNLAAFGRKGSQPDRNRPGASGQRSGPSSGGLPHTRSQKGLTVKTLTELREQRALKADRLKELTELFQADDHQDNEDENVEFDALTVEVKELDKDIRVAQFHAINGSAATAAEGKSSEGASRSRGGMSYVKRADPDDKFKGQAMTRVYIAKAAAYIAMKEGNFMSAADFAEKRWGKSHPNLVRYIKAAVAGGGTGSGEWGAELAQSDTRYNGDFVEYLYAQTIFDQLPLRPVPARVHIKGQDGAATGYWVGESKGIPVSKPDFSDVELTPMKVGAIAVCSKELVADSDPSAELWIRDSLAQASGQRVDTTFLSTDALSAGVSPAGLLNAVTGHFSAGPDAADLRDDVATLLSGFITAKNTMGLVFVTTPTVATGIAMMTNALGQPEHPLVTENGGTLMGKRVYVGNNVGAGDFILLKPSDVWKIGDTGIQVSMSDTATLEQDSAPQGATDTPVAASATLVNLWQDESIGFKVVRRINYQKRRSTAVDYIKDAAYGSGT